MTPLRTPAGWRRRPCAAALALALAGGPLPALSEDMTALSLEELMDVEVISASKYPQRIADAPAAVTVLRAADIRQFGYRTLADILRSVRGFYVSSDRQYDYIGVRGFSPPGDYNTRLLVLVDGYRINDNIYDTGSIGGEFPLDIDLIDRVEIVRGPGSSVYGSNALFGVVNVITRRGRDLDGGEAVAGLAAHRGREGRLSWGKRLDSGLELLLSASGLRNEGPDLYFPEFDRPADNHGRSSGTDYERRRQLLAKLEYGDWNLTLMDSRRDKGVPTGAFGTDFGDRGNHIVDSQTSANLGFYRILDSGTEANARLYAGDYSYRGHYIYGGTLNRDAADGVWWGGELRLVTHLGGGHKLVYGAEYQRNRKQDQQADQSFPVDRRSSSRYGVYLQDDFSFAERWTLSAGLRYDSNSGLGGNVSPRLGLIHQLAGGSVVKLLYGSAYRTPNVYERYYTYLEQQIANPDLKSERIKTYEAVWEKNFGSELRLVGSLYYYRVQDWIVQQPTLADTRYQYINQPPVSAKGFEFEAERQWQDGTRLRASYSAQSAPEHQAGALNQVPRHLVKAGLSTPLWTTAWRAGLEGQYVGSRATTAGRVDDYVLANATLLYAPRARGPEVALSFYNLFDRRFSDPTADPARPERESLRQDGRSWRLRVSIPF